MRNKQTIAFGNRKWHATYIVRFILFSRNLEKSVLVCDPDLRLYFKRYQYNYFGFSLLILLTKKQYKLLFFVIFQPQHKRAKSTSLTLKFTKSCEFLAIKVFGQIMNYLKRLFLTF